VEKATKLFRLISAMPWAVNAGVVLANSIQQHARQAQTEPASMPKFTGPKMPDLSQVFSDATENLRKAAEHMATKAAEAQRAKQQGDND
jgi:hypothetical protein